MYAQISLTWFKVPEGALLGVGDGRYLAMCYVPAAAVTMLQLLHTHVRGLGLRGVWFALALYYFTLMVLFCIRWYATPAAAVSSSGSTRDIYIYRASERGPVNASFRISKRCTSHCSTERSGGVRNPYKGPLGACVYPIPSSTHKRSICIATQVRRQLRPEEGSR